MTGDLQHRSGFPTWQCSNDECDTSNDMLRSVCRGCGTHRPCEQWRDGKKCGKTPVHMYIDGTRCLDCRPDGWWLTKLVNLTKEAK